MITEVIFTKPRFPNTSWLWLFSLHVHCHYCEPSHHQSWVLWLCSVIPVNSFSTHSKWGLSENTNLMLSDKIRNLFEVRNRVAWSGFCFHFPPELLPTFLTPCWHFLTGSSTLCLECFPLSWLLPHPHKPPPCLSSLGLNVFLGHLLCLPHYLYFHLHTVRSSCVYSLATLQASPFQQWLHWSLCITLVGCEDCLGTFVSPAPGTVADHSSPSKSDCINKLCSGTTGLSRQILPDSSSHGLSPQISPVPWHRNDHHSDHTCLPWCRALHPKPLPVASPSLHQHIQ